MLLTSPFGVVSALSVQGSETKHIVVFCNAPFELQNKWLAGSVDPPAGHCV